MPAYDYIIVGGGMAARAAVKGIRSEDQNGSIGILTSEAMIPYDRPPLSKGLWTEDDTEPEDVVSDILERDDVKVHIETRVVQLDRNNKRVMDDDNVVYNYDKLLLATGARPRYLPFDDGTLDLIYYRTLRDYQTLRREVQSARRVGVIGGGFIGSELAAALTMNDKQVAMFFPESGVAANVLPAELSEKMALYYAGKGVDVFNNHNVTGITRDDTGGYRIETDQGAEIDVGSIVVGIGVRPNTELAELAGLTVEDGIKVNDQLQTDDPHIYAAGDVACYYSDTLNTWRRVEHENNAVSQGEVAGRNMAGATTEYDHVPFFYSDMFDMGYEAVGNLDPNLDTYIDWHDDEKATVTYFDEDDIVRGVLLWNTFGKLDEARNMLGKERQPA